MLSWLKWIGTGMGIAGALVIALNLPFSGWGFVLFLVPFHTNSLRKANDYDYSRVPGSDSELHFPSHVEQPYSQGRKQMKSTDLRGHITATYINLRIGTAVLAIILPFVLWIGGHIRSDLPLLGSMSAYYHAGNGAMRDEFVGVLFAVGAFLYLYKGFTGLENFALNLAGAFVIGVAVFPMEWGCGNSCSNFSLHGTFAILFFLSIAYVCIFRASDTLGLIPDQTKIKRYKNTYRLLGLGMVASPVLALILTWVLQPHTEDRLTGFFAEAFGVWVFALYWIIKSREIALSNSERLAIEGSLSTRQHRAVDVFKQISVDHVEPRKQ